MNELSFSCRLCDKRFATQRGLSQHERRSHATAYHLEIEKSTPAGLKTRWTEEEVAIMVGKEARILLNGGSRRINMDLEQVITGRTLQSIKGQRKVASYAHKVQDRVRNCRTSRMPMKQET